MPVSLLLHFAPYIAMAVMGLGIWGLLEEHKADKAALVSSQAIIEQKNHDAVVSAQQIGKLNGQLQATEAKAQPLIKEIYHEKVTATCGPAVQRAVDGVRLLLDTSSPGSKDAGPVIVSPVHKANAAPVPLVRH
jgi:hypothetical protein